MKVLKKPSKQQLNELKPSIWVGKKGLNQQLFNEINSQIKTKGYIKVKILKIIRNEFEQILSQILIKTNAQLVEKKD